MAFKDTVELEERVVAINRVTKVSGRRLALQLFVVVGDRNGC